MITGINEILSENSALITLIGASKIFPMVVPIDTEAPYLCTSLLRYSTEVTKDSTTDLNFPVANINVHADNYDDLEEMSDAVRTALEGNTWTTDAGYSFTKIWLVNAFDRPDLYDNNKPTLTRSLQFGAILKG